MANNKRLFVVTDTQTKKVVPEMYFNDKRLAKNHRDELNAINPGRYCVSPGPDHWKGKEK